MNLELGITQPQKLEFWLLMKPKKDRIFMKIDFFKNKDIKVRDYTEYCFINRDTFLRGKGEITVF